MTRALLILWLEIASLVGLGLAGSPAAPREADPPVELFAQAEAPPEPGDVAPVARPVTPQPIRADNPPVAPAPQPVNPPAINVPPLADNSPIPVAVEFAVPDRQTAVRGERVDLLLKTTGIVAGYRWRVVPSGTVGFRVYGNGELADFTSPKPGTYVFMVSVAGLNGTTDLAYHTVVLVDSQPAVVSDPTPSPDGTGDNQPEPELNPTALVAQWTADIRSPNKLAERARVANAFRQAAGLVDAGQSNDPVATARAIAAQGLGANLGAWGVWFGKVQGLFTQMKEAGALTGAGNYSAASRSVAGVLEGGQ
jgi:hypothetical protein